MLYVDGYLNIKHKVIMCQPKEISSFEYYLYYNKYEHI